MVAMKKVLIAALVLTCCTSITAVRAQPKGMDDHAQILALEQQFTAAFRAKDLDDIMKMYPKLGGLFVFDVTPPREYVGYAAYRKD